VIPTNKKPAQIRFHSERPHTYRVMFFFMFNDLRWQVIVCFVDIGGIVGHHIWNFAFIIVCIVTWKQTFGIVDHHCLHFLFIRSLYNCWFVFKNYS
jgi:hypothetical protein